MAHLKGVGLLAGYGEMSSGEHELFEQSVAKLGGQRLRGGESVECDPVLVELSRRVGLSSRKNLRARAPAPRPRHTHAELSAQVRDRPQAGLFEEALHFTRVEESARVACAAVVHRHVRKSGRAVAEHALHVARVRAARVRRLAALSRRRLRRRPIAPFVRLFVCHNNKEEQDDNHGHGHEHGYHRAIHLIGALG